MKMNVSNEITSHEQALINAENALNEMIKKAKGAKYKPKWHFSAKAGWINDPNGVIYFKGKYHIFYQFNPYGTVWSAMHWGHAISADLVNWAHLPIALAPSEPYENHPAGGCFSGSAVDDNGILTLIYTATTNYGDGFVQTQCIATSEDGIHFTKYEGNPVIPKPPICGSNRFRDPKVWRHGEYWYMVVGSSKDNMGKALLYKSFDLRDWEFVNVLCESCGELGTMWECPDFFELGDKYVLMFSPMGLGDRKTIYLVGDMDYKKGKFHYQSIGEVDWGFDYYAPQSMLDSKGRRIIFGWANAWDWMPWWKDFGPTYKEGWCGSFGFPREVKLCKDGKLQFIPVEEHKLLREGESKETFTKISDGETAMLPSNGDLCYEMILDINIKESDVNRIEVVLKVSDVNRTIINCNLEKAELSLNRNTADGWSIGEKRCPLESSAKDSIRLHIFVDQSYIEVYTDNYRTVMSANIFAGGEATGAYVKLCGGSTEIKSISYPLKPMLTSTLY